VRSRPRSIAWAAFSFGTPLIAASGSSLVADLRTNVDVGFYSVLAQVIPVLLLALMVEMATAFPIRDVSRELQRELQLLEVLSEQGDKTMALNARRRLAELDSATELMRWQVWAFFACAAVGEAASLYAVGSNESTTFLLMLCGSETGVLFFMLAAFYGLRFMDRAEAR
jgi:hypothetical protein